MVVVHPDMCLHQLQVVRSIPTANLCWSAETKGIRKWQRNHKIINFNMIHTQCRGSLLIKFPKEYKAVTENDFKSYPEKEKLESIASCCRMDRKDLYLDIYLATKFWILYVFLVFSNFKNAWSKFISRWNWPLWRILVPAK